MPWPDPPGASKPIGVWGVHVGLWLLVLSLLPGATTLYPRWVHLQANAAFASFGSGRRLTLDSVDPASRADRSDTRMRGWQTGDAQPRFRAVFSVRRRGYWPSVVLLALLLATPAPRSRRPWALLAALLLVDALLLAEIAVLGQCAFAGAAVARGGAASAWSRAVPLATAMFNSPIPAFAWVLVWWTVLSKPSETIDLAALDRLTRSGRA